MTTGRLLSLICLCSLTLGVFFAVAAPPGQPLDEPSYFSTVRYYAEHAAMPTLGDPGVTYEAQMGPMYYVPAALLYAGLEWLAGVDAAFYGLRLANLLLLVPLVLLTYLLVRQLLPDLPVAVPLAATALVGLHPSLLSAAGSVTNDLLAVTLTAAALFLLVRSLSAPEKSVRSALLLGLIVGVAVLTKHTTMFLIPTILVAAAVVWRRKSMAWSLTFAATAVLVSGWFFVRNLVLYGDLTGEAGVRRSGSDFSVGEPLGLSELISWTRVNASYFTVPYEYYRAAFEPSLAIRVVLALVLTTLAVGCVVALRRFRRIVGLRQPAIVAAMVALAFLLSGYFVVRWTVHYVEPEVLFLLFPYFMLAALTGARGLFPRANERANLLSAAVLIALMVGIDVYVLVELQGIAGAPHKPY